MSARSHAAAAELPPVPPQTFEALTSSQAEAVNASIPFSTLPIRPAAPFRLGGASALDQARAVTCLTMAVYYEAASESAKGQAAVAQVVLNRVRNPLFPKSVCGVVFQGSELPTGCQFTFTCDGSMQRAPTAAGWKEAQEIAERALDGYVAKDVGEATHYHTVWVVPYWQPSLLKLTRIGAHIFYRWQGGLGLPAAFQAKYQGDEPPPPAPKGVDLASVVTTAQVINPVEPEAAAQPAAAPKAEPPAAPPEPVIHNPVEIAQASAEPLVKLPADLDPVAQVSYFGRARRSAGRLPVSGSW